MLYNIRVARLVQCIFIVSYELTCPFVGDCWGEIATLESVRPLVVMHRQHPGRRSA